MRQSAGDGTAMGCVDMQSIPVCLVRESRDLGKEGHEQIAVCRIDLMVRSLQSRAPVDISSSGLVGFAPTA